MAFKRGAKGGACYCCFFGFNVLYRDRLTLNGTDVLAKIHSAESEARLQTQLFGDEVHDGAQVG